MTFVIGCYCSLFCHFSDNRLLLRVIWRIFFSVIVTLLIFAVIMQHINKKTSDLKKFTIAHNSMEELRSRLRVSSVASSTFFARSDESSTAEASSTIELGSDTFYARSNNSNSGEGSGTEKHGSNFGYAQSDDGSSAEAIRKSILPSRGRDESQCSSN
jgi:hypothetical protein